MKCVRVRLQLVRISASQKLETLDMGTTSDDITSRRAAASSVVTAFANEGDAPMLPPAARRPDAAQGAQPQHPTPRSPPRDPRPRPPRKQPPVTLAPGSGTSLAQDSTKQYVSRESSTSQTQYDDIFGVIAEDVARPPPRPVSRQRARRHPNNIPRQCHVKIS